MTRFLATLLLALGLFQTAALAKGLENPETVAALNRIEAYLKSLTTVKARFIQTNPDGSYDEGTMYLDRPGRMRFEYDPPTPLLLLSNGLFFIHVDLDLEQVSHIPLKLTSAYFLLREDIGFDQGLVVTGYGSEAGVTRIEVVQEDEPDAGSVVMTFSENPLQLRQWTVTDAQRQRTTVTMLDPEFGVELSGELFNYHAPWEKDRGKNR